MRTFYLYIANSYTDKATSFFFIETALMLHSETNLIQCHCKDSIMTHRKIVDGVQHLLTENEIQIYIL